MRHLAVVALVLGASACGLDMGGLAADPLGQDASASGDAGPSAHAEGGGIAGDASSGSSSGGSGGGDASGGANDGPPSPPVDASACVAGLAPGWSLVAYEASRGPCPGGYGGGHDEVSGATAGAGACACDCKVTTPPSCDQGTLATQWGQGPSGGACSNPGAPLTVNGAGCTNFQGAAGQLQGGFSALPFAPTGGACSASINPDPSKVAKNGVRFCDVPPAAAAAVCSGAAPAGFAACIVAQGDVPCPAGAFATRTVVDDDVELLCPGCGACSLSGTCGNAQVKFYGDPQCGNLVTTLPCNGTCASTGGGGGKNVAAFEYTSQAQATCQASPSGPASFNPVNPRTLCCR